MKKVLGLLLAVILMLSVSAAAEGKARAVQKNLYTFAGENTGYFFARIENTGDETIGVGYGTLVLFTEDDEILLSQNYVGTSPSGVLLAPGEYLYVHEFLWDSALESAVIGDYKYSVETDSYAEAIARIPCEVTYSFDATNAYNSYMHVTFTNTMDTPIEDCTVSAVLLDSEGNILYGEASSTGSVAVHPGSTVTVTMGIDSSMAKYILAEGLTVASADAQVCYVLN